jgi:hypothetical protein
VIWIWVDGGMSGEGGCYNSMWNSAKPMEMIEIKDKLKGGNDRYCNVTIP